MANLDWLYAALVGAGGSLVGGAVGGWYALRAVRQQWEHDRQVSQIDRSYQAAMLIAGELASMETAIQVWKDKHDYDAVRGANHRFIRVAYSQVILLSNDEIGSRVYTHLRLLRDFMEAVRQKDEAAAELAGTVRRHADAVRAALEAHVKDRALPAYKAPPLGNQADLLNWGKPPERGIST